MNDRTAGGPITVDDIEAVRVHIHGVKLPDSRPFCSPQMAADFKQWDLRAATAGRKWRVLWPSAAATGLREHRRRAAHRNWQAKHGVWPVTFYIDDVDIDTFVARTLEEYPP